MEVIGCYRGDLGIFRVDVIGFSLGLFRQHTADYIHITVPRSF